MLGMDSLLFDFIRSYMFHVINLNHGFKHRSEEQYELFCLNER